MKLLSNQGVTAPKGFLASGIHCGLKKNNFKLDLALIYSEVQANAAGVYTKNKVKGAPIYITKEHLSNKKAQAIIVNSGNANTCNGSDGLVKAKRMAELQGKALRLKTSDILVASTGVIGVPLNIDAIKDGIPMLTERLSKEGYEDAATAIMTTDTYKKQLAFEFKIKDKVVTIGAMAKGSGMIEPNMGTMLSFITTDLNISGEMLSEALKESTKISYNRVSVDGDTSTNDMVLVLANGLASNKEIVEKNDDYYTFIAVLNTLNITLAKMIAKDGEGATKLIECIVSNCKSEKDAEILSKSVINSPLVKTAIFGSDANWGRVLCALGYSGVNINPDKVNLSFKSSVGEVEVCKDGMPLPFDEVKAKEILLKDEIQILISMNSGKYSSKAWGCDLSYDYVKINGDYRS
ncbi:bifunctional glutamate N-acetyltransferase/amino-acid acetyltransferase ArgJ [Clostridium sp.]|uniref:bifunctional glutamate N-acetyltransferase/amino-acid acetyltransferase ArgJ n=1 Tax=Clostridium sp. TaxID=1506 RepID=UPI001DAA9E7B|nr:bifunctional glutamate N-acetyltransferase/amino-acid acetyltransferase ArgJ [Clostridium sp.]MBS5938686.1 bifunctional glutamate N-acetyltransferase/amino-acid acetyltransferase ArgJ [Clostridium sp.]